MSGHNRWSKIKHKKAASDAKKSKGWTKYLKEITMCARSGGGNPSGNPRLRAAIDKARGDNMPTDTITRAIKKGTGELEQVNYEELLYEVYGPGGTAVIVDILTDNRNRTASEVRHLLERHNAKLGASGSVLYLFKKRGTIVFDGATVDEDKLMEAALELGAEDIQSGDGIVSVLTEPGQYFAIKEALEKKGFKPQGGEVAMLPETTVRLEGKEAESMAKLMNALEDHDDVQNVYVNADIDEEVMERVSGLTASGSLRILGVDPGSRRCGYGVVESRGPGELCYVECGVIELPARAPLEERLAELSATLGEVLAELRPSQVAVESVFHGIDARAALVLGHARGVVLASAGAARLPVHAYPPATVKKSVTGQGGADKAQVAAVVRALLRLQRTPRADAADALAVAICHAHHATNAALRAARVARSPGGKGPAR